jgi:hypothetical protein
MPRSFEVLAKNKTTAEFIGIHHVQCRLIGPKCPNNCHHAHDAARFKILSYEQYEKPGKYGDEKVEMLEVNLSEDPLAPQMDKQEVKIITQIKTLSPGQKVKLSWEHIYVTDETNSKYPERTIRSLESI